MRLYNVEQVQPEAQANAGDEPAGLEMKFSIKDQQLVIPEDVSVTNSRAIVVNMDLNVAYIVSGDEQRVQLAGKDVEIYRTVLHKVSFVFMTLLVHFFSRTLR